VTAARGAVPTLTGMEASLRVPFIIRWQGKIPAGRVSNEIVHIVDLFTTVARVGNAEVPKDRPIDGVDQMDLSTLRYERWLRASRQLAGKQRKAYLELERAATG